MPFWELHKQIMVLLGVLLALWFGVWLFQVRGLRAEAETLNTDFKKSIEPEIKKYCDPAQGREVRLHALRFQAANAKLETAFAEIADALSFTFPAPLIPKEHAARPQQYVRTRYRDLIDYVEREAFTMRGVELTEQARTLGFNIPAETVEDPEQDRQWLRQMIVLRRFIDILLSVREEKDTSWNLVRITRIQPLPEEKTGPPPAFLREFPLEVEMLVTLKGLMRLLTRCGAAETFHVVQSLDVKSEPDVRRSHHFRRVKEKVDERWYAHFYKVRIRLSCLTLLAEVEEAPPPEPKAPAKIRIIGH